MTDEDLQRSRPKLLTVTPPSFPRKASDFVGWKERFLEFSRQHYFEDGFEHAGDIDVSNNNSRRNDNQLPDDYDPETVASATCLSRDRRCM